MFRPLRELLDQEGFYLAFAVGLACAAAVVGWRWATHRVRPLGVAGLFGVGALVSVRAIEGTFDGATRLVVGLLLLALAGVVARITAAFWIGLLVAVPGAAAIASVVSDDLDQSMTVVVFLAVAVSAPAVAAWSQWTRMQGTGPSMLALTVAGVYFCVPDTETAAVVLGCALPLIVIGWPRRLADLGAAGGAAWVGIVAWVAATGGTARPGAVVGALACVGGLAFVPLLRWSEAWTHARRGGTLRHDQGVVLVAHLLVVFGCSRIAGLRESGWASGAIAFAVLAAGFVAVRMLVTTPGTPVTPESSA